MLIDHHTDLEAGDAWEDSTLQPQDSYFPHNAISIKYKRDKSHLPPRIIVENSPLG